MRTMRSWLFAIVAVVSVVNNSTYGQITDNEEHRFSPNSQTIQVGNSYTPSIGIIGDNSGSTEAWSGPAEWGVSWTETFVPGPGGDYHRGFGGNHIDYRIWRVPVGVTVTDNGDGTATIGGIDAWFTPGGGEGGNNWLFEGAYTIPIPPGVSPIASGQTSYPVSGSGSKVYTIVTGDGFAGNASYALQVTANFQTPATPPTITTTSLPNATQGTAYSQTLSATGTSPISWSISGSLPTGLTLIGSTISGTPTATGTFNFTVQASNAGGNATKALSITVEAAPTPPTITTTSLPNATQGTAYSQTLSATGTSPISWTISGSLPAGLTLTGSTISGTPTATGTFNFTVQASNAGGNATKALSITVEAAPTPPTITTTSLPNATQGTAYSQTLSATGTSPISWIMASGSLPAGLTLTGSTISGTPTATGTFNFTVQASNAGGNTTKALSITVDPTTGIENIECAKLNIYNEGSSLIVESDAVMTSVTIYNLSGQVVRSIQVGNTQTRIDNLPEGILVVRVVLQGGVKIEKALIK